MYAEARPSIIQKQGEILVQTAGIAKLGSQVSLLVVV